MKKEMLKSKKGITLIALVVTILVLLILAGVSIATLTGDNGIITRANEVKAQTEIAEEREQIELAYISAMGNNMSTEVILKDLQTELKNNGYENIVTSEIDENGNKGLLVNLTKKDRYYFIENGQVRIATKEEFSKEMTAVYAILYSDGDLRFNKTGNTDETKIANGATVLMKSNDISKVYMTAGSSQPWYSYETQIKSVTFEERVAPQYTSIGSVDVVI